jgi:hypothetical protein
VEKHGAQQVVLDAKMETSRLSSQLAAARQVPQIDMHKMDGRVMGSIAVATAESNNALLKELRAELATDAAEFGGPALGEWFQRLGDESLIQALHFGFSEQHFWGILTGNLGRTPFGVQRVEMRDIRPRLTSPGLPARERKGASAMNTDDLSPDQLVQLRALYQVHVEPRSDGGLPLSLDDHIASFRKAAMLGVKDRQMADALGVPLNYVTAFKAVLGD